MSDLSRDLGTRHYSETIEQVRVLRRCSSLAACAPDAHSSVQLLSPLPIATQSRWACFWQALVVAKFLGLLSFQPNWEAPAFVVRDLRVLAQVSEMAGVFFF